MTRRTKDEAVQQGIEERRFDEAPVVAALDAMDTETLVWRLGGQPDIITIHARRPPTRRADERTAAIAGVEVETLIPAWIEGEPRPRLASEDPADMCALARCALWRVRHNDPVEIIPDWIHPSACGWCAEELVDLMAALAWSTWHASYVIEQWYVWRQSEEGPGRRVQYRRTTGAAWTYENPAWAAFAALPGDDRRRQVEQAVELSRMARA